LAPCDAFTAGEALALAYARLREINRAVVALMELTVIWVGPNRRVCYLEYGPLGGTKDEALQQALYWVYGNLRWV
jgi:hypothetical protein